MKHAPRMTGGRPLSLALLLALSGCASLPLFGTKTAKFERADAKHPAAEILALWQASEGPGPNGVPTRGFAGQIFFFTQSKPSPVVVDGKVRIYLFDDHGTVKEQAKPIAEFNFDAANWNAMRHASSLGPGYAVFIPYPRNDFHQATCSLRICFTPTMGPTIYSPTAAVVLTGPPQKPTEPEKPLLAPQQARRPRPLNMNTTQLMNQMQYPGIPIGSVATGNRTSQNVTQVSGTDADTRLSLADDIAAPEQPVPRSLPRRRRGSRLAIGPAKAPKAGAGKSESDDE